MCHTQALERLVSRIKAEQRIRHDNFAHRSRYRISVDFQLQGLKVDPREFYAVIANEMLWEAQTSLPSTLENRLSAALGFIFSSDLKAEISAIHHFEDFNLQPFSIWFFNTRVLINIPRKIKN